MQRRELLSLLAATGGAALAGLNPADLWGRVRYRQAIPATGPFTALQATTLDHACELILPATDTPGAREAGVPGFIAVIVGEWDTPEDRKAFLSGLDALNASATSRFGTPFPETDSARQMLLLQELDAEVQAIRARRDPLDGNFFQRLKSLTLYGFYTSEIGMNQELHYELIPGRYDGCAPVGYPQ